jgi:hypothetical protein
LGHDINPDLERFKAKLIKATTLELTSSHVPMLSQPKKVAESPSAPKNKPTNQKPFWTSSSGPILLQKNHWQSFLSLRL